MSTKILTLEEINNIVKGELEGDPKVIIKGASGIKEAQEGDITFLANPKYEFLVDDSNASAIIMSRDMPKPKSKPVIRVENPSLAFAELITRMFPSDKRIPKGIHETALLGRNVSLGKGVCLGPYVVIEDDCRIEDNSIICAGVFIGFDTSIGTDSFIYPNVTIREKTQIGNHVIIYSGTVIGSDGFGFEQVNGANEKIPQVGIVVVEDNCEIGSCSTIDRARFGKTVIGRGTKIDNLVQIGHNVQIGENSIIIAQTGVSGSSKIGKKVILAGQSGIVGHIELGDNVIVGAQAGVTKSVPRNSFVVGSPAKPHRVAKKIFAGWLKIEDLIKEVADLREEVSKLTQKRARGGKTEDNKE